MNGLIACSMFKDLKGDGDDRLDPKMWIKCFRRRGTELTMLCYAFLEGCFSVDVFARELIVEG